LLEYGHEYIPDAGRCALTVATLEESVLTLDYSDSAKFGGAHGYSNTRVKQLELLQEAIKEIFDVELEIRQIP
jgi:hypothetical protein